MEASQSAGFCRGPYWAPSLSLYRTLTFSLTHWEKMRVSHRGKEGEMAIHDVKKKQQKTYRPWGGKEKRLLFVIGELWQLCYCIYYTHFSRNTPKERGLNRDTMRRRGTILEWWLRDKGGLSGRPDSCELGVKLPPQTTICWHHQMTQKIGLQ